MLLTELSNTPVDLTPEQVREAQLLAQALASIEPPVLPTITEACDDEFVEM